MNAKKDENSELFIEKWQIELMYEYGWMVKQNLREKKAIAVLENGKEGKNYLLKHKKQFALEKKATNLLHFWNGERSWSWT